MRTAILVATVLASSVLAVADEPKKLIASDDPARVEIVSRFQMRDPQIEHIGWAVKAEIEAGCPGGRLFLDSLGLALATRLLHQHSTSALPMPRR